MGRRRFLPLIVLVVLGALLLMARLYSIQISERGIWTAQAEALLRQGELEPYTRGEILDRDGRVLARDIEAFRIDAQYRDFRRGHALGIVTHARSALEMRPVGLGESKDQLAAWVVALAQLSPAQIGRFQRGEELSCGGLLIPGTEDAQAQARSARGLDLAFYATALFDLSARERGHLKKLKGEQREKSFLDFVAKERKRTPTELQAQLSERAESDLRFLADFAQLWSADNNETSEDSFQRLLGQLEGWRANVEDGAAGDLFAAATGFPAGRIEAASLEQYFDLEWIRRSLYWDAARITAWTRAARAGWLEQRDGAVLDFAIERVRREVAGIPRAQLVLREIGAQFIEQRRRSNEVLAFESDGFSNESAIVLGALGKLFDIDLPSELRANPALPMFDAAFCDAVAARPDDVGLLAGVEFWRSDQQPIDPALLESAAAAWRARFEPRLDLAGLRSGMGALFLRMEDEFQSQLGRRLEAVRELAREEGRLGAPGKLDLADSSRDHAQERVAYILKDRGSRSFIAVARPSYAVVNLLTRYPERLRGFDVVRVHSRVHPTRDAQDRVIARLLLGQVAPPNVARRLSQAETAREVALLEARGDRDEADDAMLAELRSTLDRPDEKVGSSGLERWFERELVGRNGFREARGMGDDDRERRAHAEVPRVDGRSITTTLQALLQQDAEYCLEHPASDPNSPGKADDAWEQNPTGAIVLLSPEGDVLVAASVPLQDRGILPNRMQVSDDVRERTLTKPDFQPPGSVFKPFVAAYALDQLGLDPRLNRECSAAMNVGGRGPGYGGVHCHETVVGHGRVDMHRALAVSCNSYFAWLGEQYDATHLQAMAKVFGFGQPTGVRSYDPQGRSGILEHSVGDLFLRPSPPLIGRSLREAGNGLSVVEVTPMQVARAMAGLATGELPTLRLVSHIDGVELPRASQRLQISPQALDLVRRAMLGVCAEVEGSAHAALSPAQLGFSMAAKTGSADVDAIAVKDGRVTKHTWVAGWFPADKPVGILVVFVHRTTSTSSHGAVWLARQFLQRPAVKAWIAQELSAR